MPTAFLTAVASKSFGPAALHLGAEVLAAERSVALARQLRGFAAELVRVSELRLKALDIPRASLLQSQVESESAALLEQQATRRKSAVLGKRLGPQRTQS